MRRNCSGWRESRRAVTTPWPRALLTQVLELDTREGLDIIVTLDLNVWLDLVVALNPGEGFDMLKLIDLTAHAGIYRCSYRRRD